MTTQEEFLQQQGVVAACMVKLLDADGDIELLKELGPIYRVEIDKLNTLAEQLWPFLRH